MVIGGLCLSASAGFAQAQQGAVLTPSPTAVATLTPQQEIDFRYFSEGLEAGKERVALQDAALLGVGVVIGILVALVLQLGQALFGRLSKPAVVEHARLPTIFKTITSGDLGDRPAWEPDPGTRFRLLRYRLMVTANAAMTPAGLLTISLRDDTQPLEQTHSVFVPATTAASGQPLYDSGWVDLGDGRLSAATNRKLNLNLSQKLDDGVVSLAIAGTED